MDLESKRLVVVVPNEAPAPSRRVLSSEDEAWRSYLENPLTAATKAMMSLNGDEDSAAALGLLYDYYKVPRDRRRCTSIGVKPADSSAFESGHCRTIHLLNQHVQALRSMPVNLSLNSSSCSTITELHRSKYEAVSRPGDRVEGGRKSGDCMPLALVKPESQSAMLDSCTGGSYQEDLGEQRKLAYDHSSYNLSLGGYLKNDQQSSSDSMCEDTEERETYHSSPSAGVDPSNDDLSAFRYNLEASMSLRPRHAEGPMAYLNRGQFYALTLSEPSFRSSKAQGGPAEGPEGPRDSVVQSVIMVVFGEDKSRDEQLKNWKYWHGRQHTAKQRVLDIADYKESFSTIGNLEEIAYNAVSFTWDASEEAKVFISVNCLSTDFSSQKGVKGMPLIIQIDTYSYNSSSSRPIHRAYTQIKVFCDKGAERKLRDEEKKQLKKRMKGKTVSSGTKSPVQRVDNTLLRSLLDLDSQPVLFIPDVHFGNLQRAGQVFTLHTENKASEGGTLTKRVLGFGEYNEYPPTSKRSKVEVERKVLLYVRKESDEVFDALMLHSRTLQALMEAISEKYAVPVQKMAKVYQKSKKGVLVNVDDNMVQHYSNEDTFILAMESSADSLRVTLSEI